MKCLVVVDMQKDFVSGALGSLEAEKIVPQVVKRVKKALDEGEKVLFTRDTHETDYLNTQEGQYLPVPHCIRGTEGWQIIEELRGFADGRTVVDKPTFGSRELGELLTALHQREPLEEITFIGLCTDICVISNALLAKAFLPEVPIAVEADCCAGVTPESHATALRAMESCQIAVR